MTLNYSKELPIEYSGYLERLQEIFAAMDRAYQTVSDRYHFNCSGCDDSCCLTRFYHHTYLEYFYLRVGYRTLGRENSAEIQNRARRVCDELKTADETGEKVRRMCPINVDGLCSLYEYRPMICRLHGIPHELHKPGLNVVYGPGCNVFSRQCGQEKYDVFDRTPFYYKMTELENKLKQALRITAKTKMTVAEMVVTFESPI